MNNLPTPILSCACITAFCTCITALLLIFALSRIVTALGNIRITLDLIHRDLVMLFEIKRKNNPLKQREYWRDHKHWRQKDA